MFGLLSLSYFFSAPFFLLVIVFKIHQGNAHLSVQYVMSAQWLLTKETLIVTTAVEEECGVQVFAKGGCLLVSAGVAAEERAENSRWC